MMSNSAPLQPCAAFWSTSGELLAMAWEDPHQPIKWTTAQSDFLSWSSAWHLPSGRLTPLHLCPPHLVPPLQSGWQALGTLRPVRSRRRTPTRPPVRLAEACAVPAPERDYWAWQLLPAEANQPQFILRAQPSWVRSVAPPAMGASELWRQALDATTGEPRFWLRIPPVRGKHPSSGWQNILYRVLQTHGAVRLVSAPVPPPEFLTEHPAWEYRVEAGNLQVTAAWDVQIFPERKVLAHWLGCDASPWEATAVLRWLCLTVEQSAPPVLRSLSWGHLLGILSGPDVRLLVQNVLLTLPGGAAASAPLLYQTQEFIPEVAAAPLTKIIPQPGVPIAFLSTLYSRRAWQAVERAKRNLPVEAQQKELQSQGFAEIERHLNEGRLLWSEEARGFWKRLYRDPEQRRLQVELEQRRSALDWDGIYRTDARQVEEWLRRLDVTDLAIGLRRQTDQRWRRFVTARREAEIRQELEFLEDLDRRQELSLERQLEAWTALQDLAVALLENS